MTVEMDSLDRLGAAAFDGFLVRKDLVRRYARQYPVPTYVVEFLLGHYCASVDEEEIAEGLEIVEKQLRDRTVRTGTEELFKAQARDRGSEDHLTSSKRAWIQRTTAISPSCPAWRCGTCASMTASCARTSAC